MADARIDLVRLTEVPLDAVVALLNEPRNTRHMPLSNPFTPESAREWVQAKDGQWAEHGYGPWAVLVDGDFAGWGGFQREPNGADFALVLFPQHWGRGAAITREVLQRGFTELGLTDVLIALPHPQPRPRRRPARLPARRRSGLRRRRVPAVPAHPAGLGGRARLITAPLRRWRSGVPGPRRRAGAPP